jgi:hypothetical protein
VIREELRRLAGWEERHRRLVARVAVAVALTLVVDGIGSVLMWTTERDAHGTAIKGFGDALFFTTAQLLTVSSSMPNPLTAAGRAVDLGLEAWAVVVVTAVGGSFAAFFNAADRAAQKR